MRINRRNIISDAPDLPAGRGGQTYRIKIATEAWELRGYARLRRETFCVEQGLFQLGDHDEHDVIATPIIAVSDAAVCFDEVVGCVRIFPCDEAGVWYGSRLSVAPEWRGVGSLVTGLIRAAVRTAHARGCKRFLATVQRQNVPLFRRLHWRDLEEMEVRGRVHMLMQADLSHYPPLDIATLPTFKPAGAAS
jgi:putative N-acetyltransferase (TIGR04045 family)